MQKVDFEIDLEDDEFYHPNGQEPISTDWSLAEIISPDNLSLSISISAIFILLLAALFLS
jgi:hypothetical protein